MTGETRQPGWLQGLAMLLAVAATVVLMMAPAPQGDPQLLAVLALIGALALGALDLRLRSPWVLALMGALIALGASGMLADLRAPVAPSFWAMFLAVWLGAWMLEERLANLALRSEIGRRITALIVPIIFGLTLLWLWEAGVRGGNVPPVILPAPTDIAARMAGSGTTLWRDFHATFVMGALTGYAMGCGAAVLVALAVDRYDFLRRGLLPVGNFAAALPIVGTAPIMVMWFGFGWQSKAAVVVAMVFFPMLVNTVQGLLASEAIQRDLMRTYSASHRQSLLKLRLPAAMPFIFNGLKICSTLALIGAIVAEFFGSPTHGMGFRISSGVGRLQLDMVWATIVIAAISGSSFYGILAALEKRVTFWHPSQRGR